MRILLDESLPRKLGFALTGHHLRTVQQMGWSGLTNHMQLATSIGSSETPANAVDDSARFANPTAVNIKLGENCSNKRPNFYDCASRIICRSIKNIHSLQGKP